MATKRSVERSLKCLSLGNEAYSMAKELANNTGLSTSALVRQLIKKTYQRFEKKVGADLSKKQEADPV